MRLAAGLSIAVALLCLLVRSSAAGEPLLGRVLVPASSVEHPGDIGLRAHTNVGIVALSEGKPAMQPEEVTPMGSPPVFGYSLETPASLGCIYGLVSPIIAGCDPNVVNANPTGGSKAIAIVDAFDDATAVSDLKTFSTQFGLAAPNLTVVFAQGTRPPIDKSGGWEIEESLDVQWAHAMAPGAKLYLVETADDHFTHLLAGVDKASALVAAAGGGEESNSWGSSEFSGETGLDSHFKTASVVYFASSGDSPGVLWPSTSPFVVSAGGTTTDRNCGSLNSQGNCVGGTGNFIKETAWQVAGGGPSAFEPRPSYQAGVAGIVGSHRGTPDVSADSSTLTPHWVFDSNPVLGTGWFGVWGTSAASPTFAGIVNSAGRFAASTNAELTTIYANRSNPADFTDITVGSCGPFGEFLTLTGYDLCTGVGSPKGKAGK